MRRCSIICQIMYCSHHNKMHFRDKLCHQQHCMSFSWHWQCCVATLYILWYREKNCSIIIAPKVLFTSINTISIKILCSLCIGDSEFMYYWKTTESPIQNCKEFNADRIYTPEKHFSTRPGHCSQQIICSRLRCCVFNQLRWWVTLLKCFRKRPMLGENI